MWLIDHLYTKLGIKYCLLFLKFPLYLKTSRNFYDDVRLSDSYNFFCMNMIWICNLSGTFCEINIRFRVLLLYELEIQKGWISEHNTSVRKYWKIVKQYVSNTGIRDFIWVFLVDTLIFTNQKPNSAYIVLVMYLLCVYVFDNQYLIDY